MHTKTKTKHRTTINKTMNQQQQSPCLRMDSSLSHWGGGGLNAFYYQIFAVDSVVVKVQKILAGMEAF